MTANMRERIKRLREGIEHAQRAPLMAKVAHAEALLEDAIGLLEVMVERIEHLEIYSAESDPAKLETLRKLEREVMGHGC